jgi:putative hydrolase
VSTPGPFGGNPFEGLPFFKDLAKLFSAQGALNFDFARQLAQWVATEGAVEGNVDPVVRIRIEEVARVAEMHVGAITGLSTTATGRALAIRPVGRGEWAQRTLDDWKPVLEKLATSLGQGALTGEEHIEPDPETELLGGIGQLVVPLLMGGQAGSMVGHLSRRLFGQYDLPLPRPASDEIMVIAANMDEFAADWSLPPDDVRLWVCLGETAHHAVLTRTHVRAHLDQLLSDYAAGFRPDPSAIESRFGELDPTDPDSLNNVLGDPQALLGAMQSDEQRAIAPQLEALVAVIEGYVDWVVDSAGRKLISSYQSLAEALRRRRVERGDGDKLVERLFGLELGQAQYDRGAAFVRGVLERAGEDGLGRLWRSERELPTPAEVDAPGLWLARLEFDQPG